jgi:hypothetical protein
MCGRKEDTKSQGFVTKVRPLYILAWSCENFSSLSLTIYRTIYAWNSLSPTVGDFESIKSTLLSLSSLQAATDNFSENNKLGEGGFGSVYKVW